jgi:hypothetical protein
LEVNEPPVTVNEALLDPGAAITDAGTLTGPVEESPTVAPPAPAAPLRFTVQVLDPPGTIEVGVHAMLVIINGATTETEPPVALTATAAAVTDAPIALVIPNVEVPGAVVGETETFATVPSGIAVPFDPQMMQLYIPVPGAQVSVKPAAVRPGSGATAMLVMVAVG